MKKSKSIQLKAAFLLTVFALNTVVGFACSVGVDMGFNSGHHEEKNTGAVHVHANGKKHIHQPTPHKQGHDDSAHGNQKHIETTVHVHGKKHLHQPTPHKHDHDTSANLNQKHTETTVHVHANGKKHIHQEGATKHSLEKTSSQEEANNHPEADGEKDNCCNDKVTKFEQLDKSVAPTFAYISPVFFTAFLSTFYYNDVLYTFDGSSTIKYFVRSYHPPIPDIRIAIQSFQI